MNFYLHRRCYRYVYHRKRGWGGVDAMQMEISDKIINKLYSFFSLRCQYESQTAQWGTGVLQSFCTMNVFVDGPAAAWWRDGGESQRPRPGCKSKSLTSEVSGGYNTHIMVEDSTLLNRRLNTAAVKLKHNLMSMPLQQIQLLWKKH